MSLIYVGKLLARFTKDWISVLKEPKVSSNLQQLKPTSTMDTNYWSKQLSSGENYASRPCEVVEGKGKWKKDARIIWMKRDDIDKIKESDLKR